MNWYYHIGGMAQGPMDDQAMAALVRDGDLQPDSLIWQPALSHWQTVRQLSPLWAQPEPSHTPATQASTSTHPAPPAVRKSQQKAPVESSASNALTPRAPSASTAPPQKEGFFKRLFKKG